MNTQSKIKKITIIKSKQGLALILTLMLLTILTAMIIEFSYGVYITTVSLNNWQQAQRLYYASKSGIAIAIKTISEIPQTELYRFTNGTTIPISEFFDKFSGNITITLIDENSKFNLNSIINENQTLNNEAYNFFKRLLKNLELNEVLADYLADWIDKDREPRYSDSEENAKNSYLESIDELLLIKGYNQSVFLKLQPYITVYEIDKGNPQLININTASELIIISLAEGITTELAQRIILGRPFENVSSIEKVAPGLGLNPTKVTVTPVNFRIISIAEENKVKRVIDCVVQIKRKSNTIRYWKES